MATVLTVLSALMACAAVYVWLVTRRVTPGHRWFDPDEDGSAIAAAGDRAFVTLGLFALALLALAIFAGRA
jgi:hypothetical protein